MPLVAEFSPLRHATVLLAAIHRQKPTMMLDILRSKALATFAETLPHIDDGTIQTLYFSSQASFTVGRAHGSCISPLLRGQWTIWQRSALAPAGRLL